MPDPTEEASRGAHDGDPMNTPSLRAAAKAALESWEAGDEAGEPCPLCMGGHLGSGHDEDPECVMVALRKALAAPPEAPPNAALGDAAERLWGLGGMVSAWMSNCTDDLEAEGEIIHKASGAPTLEEFLKGCGKILQGIEDLRRLLNAAQGLEHR